MLTFLPLLCSPSVELSDPTLIIDPITEERASRTLYRIELLRRIREQVLPHPLLSERLKLCQPSPDLPEWWECGRHDHDLLLGACKHGVSRTDYHILNDPSLGFLESHQRYTNHQGSGVYVGIQTEAPKPDIGTTTAAITAPLLTPAELASAAAAAAQVVAKEEEGEDKEVKMEEEKPDTEVKIKEEGDVADGAHSEMEVPQEKEDKIEVRTDTTTENVKQEEEQPKVEKEEEEKEMQIDEETTSKPADDQNKDPKEPEEASTLDTVGEQKEASAELQKDLAASPTVPQEEYKAGEEEREEKENPDSPKSLKSAETVKSPEEEDEERMDEDDKSEKSSQAEGEEEKVGGPQVQVSVVKVLQWSRSSGPFKRSSIQAAVLKIGIFKMAPK